MHKLTIPIALPIALLIAVLTLAGCSSAEEQAGEETTEETTEMAATDPDQEIIERCQGDPTNVWYTDRTLEEQVLGHEGYDQNDEPPAGTKCVALQEMRKHPEKDWCGGFTPRGAYDIVPANEINAAVTKTIHESETRMQQAKTGKNEAGQDVSNIPQKKMTPEQSACFRNYFESLPRDQRGKEQQRVTAEANERGITPPEAVGC